MANRMQTFRCPDPLTVALDTEAIRRGMIREGMPNRGGVVVALLHEALGKAATVAPAPAPPAPATGRRGLTSGTWH